VSGAAENTAAGDEAMDWQKAREHFEVVVKQYQDLEGTPGVNTTLALRLTFDPLRVRFNRGERSRSLYDAMMGVE
jgi:hypothetical protein